MKGAARFKPAIESDRLDLEFFQRDAATVARDLVGKILVRKVLGKTYRARIVETEAYVGPHDLACHAAKGRTRRTEVMFGPGGHVYMYFIYGMYDMLNVVTGHEGDAQAVLIRAAEPLDGWEADLSGPGKLTRAMKITRAENGVALNGDALHFLEDAGYEPRIVLTKRVGVEYAKQWAEEGLRYCDAKSAAVSKPKPKIED